MRFSITSAFVVMVTAVNASSIHFGKRASANVESCSSSVADISIQSINFKHLINSGGILQITSGYKELEDRIRGAQTACCAITNPILVTDAVYFLTTYSDTVALAQDLLSTVASKAKKYDVVFKPTIKNHIEILEHFIKRLSACLLTFTPASESVNLQQLVSKIEASFTSALAAYN